MPGPAAAPERRIGMAPGRVDLLWCSHADYLFGRQLTRMIRPARRLSPVPCPELTRAFRFIGFLISFDLHCAAGLDGTGQRLLPGLARASWASACLCADAAGLPAPGRVVTG